MTTTAPATGVGTDASRFELLRALGACTVIAPPAGRVVTDALGLPAWDAASHTRLFVMELPPHASIHLGSRGWLGGDGAERVAGVWRALGLDPPADADHLGSLLGLYAHLGQAALTCGTSTAAARLDHARTAVLHEHLWSWVPGYLTAVLASDPDVAGAAWARLLEASLWRELEASSPPVALAAALREAEGPLGSDPGLDELLDACVAPVRVGFVLTWTDMAAAAGRLGIGLRRGERRFALRAMLDQDAAGTLGWLADHADRWAELHRPGPGGGADPAAWWRRRAMDSGPVLRELSSRAGGRA